MQRIVETEARPELKRVIGEASRALAGLDAERLGELALSCRALNQRIAPATEAERAEIAFEARESAREMVVFARVLEATRANVNVMKRLRELRSERLEYAPRAENHWGLTESEHGDH